MLQRLTKPVILGLVLVATGLALLLSSGTLLGEPAKTITSPPTSEGPRLVFAEQVADYGDVPIEETVNHSFEFTNTGDAPLIIEGNPTVQTVAGC
jgi:hypothetical protein